ncbi:YtxH domain-containing protein [Ureibacillus manganicus]|uniref:Gas vesicle protein n=1 Tax=Ureibacillus manganicus DSM 26584 TaxID=1384049 RepID=A0A0A3I5H2_9BACL|nr:YtxH domain-containing protein [Ureibacillus manganicus]KGR79969.1 gas vesicle protein [Ureibacillus manganicus DSM 26584]
MKAKTFFLGVTVGLVGGLATAIFTTPQSGDQFRSTIAKNAKTTKANLDEVKQQVFSVKDSVVDLTNEAKNNIPKIISDLKMSISKFNQQIEPDATKLKEELDNLQNSIAEIENNLNDLNKK